MAYDYTHSTVLSKVILGGNTYYLKDADVRAIIDTYGTAVTKDFSSDNTLATDDALPTASAVKAYVASELADLHSFEYQIYDQLPTATANTMYIIGLVADATAPGNYVEYLTIRSGESGSYTYTWEQIGTTATDLSDYLTSVSYDTTTHELSQTKGGTATVVHQFGALADKSSATGTVDLVDTITMKTLTSTGSATISYTSTTVASEGDYTPEGSISVGTGASVSYDKVSAVSISATASDTGNYTPEGSITITPSASKSFAYIPNGTEIPSITLGSGLTATTEGVVASVGSGEQSEALILAAAGTTTVLAPSDVSITVAATATVDTAIGGIDSASFTGTKVDLSATTTQVPTSATVTDAVYSFSGTSATISVSGSYDKADASASVSVSAVPEIDAITTKAVTVTVS